MSSPTSWRTWRATVWLGVKVVSAMVLFGAALYYTIVQVASATIPEETEWTVGPLH